MILSRRFLNQLGFVGANIQVIISILFLPIDAKNTTPLAQETL